MDLWPPGGNLGIYCRGPAGHYGPGFRLSAKPHPSDRQNVPDTAGGGLGAAAGQSGIPGIKKHGGRTGF